MAVAGHNAEHGPGGTDAVASWEVPSQSVLQGAPPPPVHTPPQPMAAPPRRNRFWLAGLFVVVLVIVVAALAMCRQGSSDPDHGAEGVPPGQGTIGTAPAGTATTGTVPGGQPGANPGDPGAGATSAVAGPGTSASTNRPEATQTTAAPGTLAPVPPPPDVRRGTLVVVSRIVVLVTYSVEITIRNEGAAPATWHSISLRLTPVTLAITPPNSVIDSVVSGVHCLVPTGSGTVAAGQSVAVSVSILGVLTAATVGLDEAPCPA